jgi:hypothetical protein
MYEIWNENYLVGRRMLTAMILNFSDLKILLELWLELHKKLLGE